MASLQRKLARPRIFHGLAGVFDFVIDAGVKKALNYLKMPAIDGCKQWFSFWFANVKQARRPGSKDIQQFGDGLWTKRR
ncbi:hypothetical protein [Methyloversatilis sp.]|uniref:hypothetical protein n=1 Tax=Methyloversatilis sp. TaxID=2569862 RepID=UPI003F6E5B8B